jgi:hypothetical protein
MIDSSLPRAELRLLPRSSWKSTSLHRLQLPCKNDDLEASLRIEFSWKMTDGSVIDKLVIEAVLEEDLTTFLSRLMDLPELLQVDIDFHQLNTRVFARIPNNDVLVAVSFPHGDPSQGFFDFRGNAPPHKMISLWEHRFEHSKSFYYANVDTDPFESWDNIRNHSATAVADQCSFAMEIACGLGDLRVANAYLDRALAIGMRMREEEVLKHGHASSASELGMLEATLDHGIMIARLWRFGEWDDAHASTIITRMAGWYLEKGRKTMWPQNIRSHALSCLRFCYVAGDLATAKLVWSKMKKNVVEQDMALWASVEREKSVPARADLIQGYLDSLPRNFNKGGLIMNGIAYQADLAMAVLRLKHAPVEAMLIGPLSTYLRQKPRT